MSATYKSFSSMYKYSIGQLFLELSISISTTVIVEIKYGLFSKHFFQRKRQYGGWKNLTVTTHLAKKITPFSYYMEQKAFIEASCIYNISHTHWGKPFLQLLLWKVCESCRLGQIKKLEVDFGLYEPSFAFIEKKRPQKYCLCELGSISYM